MARRYPEAAHRLAAFEKAAQAAQRRNIVELREVYPPAHAVRVASARYVMVFNVAGNKYRLITAIHFNHQILFTLRFLTHAQYSKMDWKNEL